MAVQLIFLIDTKMNYNRRFGFLKLTPKCVNAEFPKTFQLSQEQLDFFADNGYLVIKNLIDFGSLNSYRKRFSEICDGSAPRGIVTIVKEPKLIKEAKTLEDCVNKDLYYFPFRPAEKIVTTWTAIDEVTIENGCLYVLPGSHKGDLHRHGYPEKFDQLFHWIMDEDKVAPEHKRVDLVMGPGDTVFFQSGLVHGSRPNVSKVYRKIISCHYASGDCHYIDLTGTIQQKIADEIVAVFKKRGVDLTYEEMWRHKSKQVKPTKSNL
ncbi:phytanoyl-CoA dioxygenase, peroxisomal-like isoform X2 [Ostrinia nubilalis]|uniref:phytanoyl-CoA dioxygenase, peroxisomal-like isoform X2 n=1 Tax=Ostrinia nubilalis TaxID=29057 RepID=UPI00308258D8